MRCPPGYPSNSLGWQTKQVRVKYLALLWALAGAAGVEKQYGITVRKSRWSDDKA